MDDLTGNAVVHGVPVNIKPVEKNLKNGQAS